MSVDYYFACMHCRECIHVAQDGLSGFTFYSGEPDCVKTLGAFLKDHSLCGDVHFVNEHTADDMDEREWKTAQEAAPGVPAMMKLHNLCRCGRCPPESLGPDPDPLF